MQIVVTVLFTHTTHMDGSVTVNAQPLEVKCDFVDVVCDRSRCNIQSLL